MGNYKEHNVNVKKYIDSYSATSGTVPQVIDRLLTDLKDMNYPKEEIEEIILSMDEALTNAIQETIRKEHNLNIPYDPDMREITVMYIVMPDEFEAVIIDHGKGLDLQESIKKTPDKHSLDYFEQITRYSFDKELGLHVRVNGQQISLKGIGAGLKIMCAFMDSITIDLIDKEKIVSDTVTPVTDGTILTMRRKRRY
ncbi:MAG: ATP-binding protein [Spirochaetes bacterium]|nr:ATP-binding protein [Spirochaetota bacterium]